MIITNLIGGLGNQMFQYACGRAASLRWNQPLLVSVDQFSTYKLHNGLEINRVFHGDVRTAGAADLRALLGWQAHPFVRKLLARPALAQLRRRAFVAEPHFHHWDGLQQRPLRDVYLHGYWQSERYFADAAAQIRADFGFASDWDEPDRAVLERMRAGPSLSVHVRRGDYTSKKNTGLYAACDLDYYRRAIRHVRERSAQARLFVFSDDPDWVQANLGPEFGELEAVRHNTGARSARDMRLMSCADHHVIANSSFSWWGAWLNPSPEKIVVAPRQWFVNEAAMSSADLIPASWVRL
jgi:hypothetical protein